MPKSHTMLQNHRILRGSRMTKSQTKLSNTQTVDANGQTGPSLPCSETTNDKISRIRAHLYSYFFKITFRYYSKMFTIQV